MCRVFIILPPIILPSFVCLATDVNQISEISGVESDDGGKESRQNNVGQNDKRKRGLSQSNSMCRVFIILPPIILPSFVCVKFAFQPIPRTQLQPLGIPNHA